MKKKNNMKKKNIFQQIISKEIYSNIVYEDDNYLACYDIYPKASKHIILFPKILVKTLNELKKNTHENLISDMFFIAIKISKKLGIDKTGYRVVFNCNSDAGQEIYHIHMHILGGSKLGSFA